LPRPGRGRLSRFPASAAPSSGARFPPRSEPVYL
jgi:hypothetical protein